LEEGLSTLQKTFLTGQDAQGMQVASLYVSTMYVFIFILFSNLIYKNDLIFSLQLIKNLM